MKKLTKPYLSYIVYIFLFSSFYQCSNNEKSNKEYLIGGWYFIEGNSYFEMYFDEEYMLLHNELIGTKIQKYILLNNGNIQCINGKTIVEEYMINHLSHNKAKILFQDRSFDLKRLDSSIVISNLQQGDTKILSNFWNQFNIRKSKYLNQSPR